MVSFRQERVSDRVSFVERRERKFESLKFYWEPKPGCFLFYWKVELLVVGYSFLWLCHVSGFVGPCGFFHLGDAEVGLLGFLFLPS